MLKKAKVRAAIDKVSAAQDKAAIATAAERDEVLTRILRNQDVNPQVAIKAIAELNKCGGRHLMKHEHSGPNGRPIQVITRVAHKDGASA